jgi:hypothetical protein
MRPLVKKFIAELYQSKLRGCGFRKTYHTFSRKESSYVEYFEIQGSAWNLPEKPWRFYINVSVDFPDLPELERVYHHASCRIEAIVNTAASEYDLSEETYQTLLTDIPKYFEEASVCLPALVPPIYEYVKARHLPGIIPIPLKWLQSGLPPKGAS